MAPDHSTTYTKTVERIERTSTSRMGNPTYRVRFSDGHTALTETDGSVGYEIDNYRPGDVLEVKAHARSGRIWSVWQRPQPGDLVEKRHDRLALDPRMVVAVGEPGTPTEEDVWLDFAGRVMGPFVVHTYVVSRRATDATREAARVLRTGGAL